MKKYYNFFQFNKFTTLSQIAFLVGLSLLFTTPPPLHADAIEDRYEIEKISEEEARKRISAFRDFHYEGDFSFKFDFINMPRNGDPHVYPATLWGTWNSNAPHTRYDISTSNGQSLQILIQSGTNPKIWTSHSKGPVQELDKKDWFKPLFDNITYTYFDLSLSFIYWDNFTYLGPKRIKGRPAQTFILKPPAEITAVNPNLSGVYLALDSDYNVLIEAQLLDKEGKIIQSTKLNGFKKVDREYVIKQVDVIDEITHDKTRLDVAAAILNTSIKSEFFEPNSLNKENPNFHIQNYQHVR